MGRKLAVDFAAGSRLRQEMDKDAADLIAQLCTRVGMIMEDMTLLALTTGNISDTERSLALARLEVAAAQITSLIAAARAIHSGSIEEQ